MKCKQCLDLSFDVIFYAMLFVAAIFHLASVSILLALLVKKAKEIIETNLQISFSDKRIYMVVIKRLC